MSVATAVLEEKTTTQEPISLLNQIAALGRSIVVEDLSREDFCFLAAKYPELRMEHETNGNVTIMAPIAGFGGMRESRINTRLTVWSEKNKNGEILGACTGYELPDGSTRSPDSSWISPEKWKKLVASYKGGFLKVVPDFVIEIVSKSDRPHLVQKKMSQTWIANGVKLAWMIDPYRENVFIYRANGTVEMIEGFDNVLSGEDVLPDFELDLREFKLVGGG